MCACVHRYHCIQLLYKTQHRTVLIIFPLILQTIIIVQMMLTGGERGAISATAVSPADMAKNTTAGSDVLRSRSFLRFSFSLKYRRGGRPYCPSDEAVSVQALLEIPAIKNASSKKNHTCTSTLWVFISPALISRFTPRSTGSQQRALGTTGAGFLQAGHLSCHRVD